MEADKPAEEIDGDFVPLPRTSVASVEIDGESVLVVEGTNNVHWLDPVATVVWGCFDGTITLGQLSVELSDAFDEREDVVRRDVLELAQRLGRAGLLEGVVEEIHEHRHTMPEGLPRGADVPSFDVVGLDGERATLDDLRGQDVLLVNWSPRCGFCRRIAAELGDLQADLEERSVRLVLLSIGSAEENRELLESEGLDCMLLLTDGAPDLFAGMGTPCAYLVDTEGRIASDLAIGALDVPVLARRAAGREEAEIES